MSISIIPSESIREKNESWLDKLVRTGVINRLRKINVGRLILLEKNERMVFGEELSEGCIEVVINVRHTRFYSSIAFGGSVGAGESYMYGDWECDDLTSLVRLLLINRDVLDGMDGHFARLKTPFFKLFHWLNRNTREGSKKNISAHYDLGNDFFSLFLDKNMMYSSAVYPDKDSTLEQAADYKLDLICLKLQLTEQDHVIEIGTGWGGFAIHAAKHYGCKVITTTISNEQYQMAKQRIENEGLSDQITVLLKDYRDLEGKYDKLVSIEMIEAIGHHYIDTYFKKCSDLLKPDGQMLIQAITIADQRYEEALKEVDFIKRYIFPGCFIPSITAMQNALTKSTDMKISNLEDIGPHYAKTLYDWRQAFFKHIATVKEQGYSDEFIKMWEFYLCYCEGGFEERVIGNVQLLLSKPDNRATIWGASLRLST